MATVAELLNGHVTLSVDSLDRLYLNGYAPKLQTGAQLVRFLEQRRGGQVCSPALLEHADARLTAAVEQFAAARGLPISIFRKRDRKDDIAAKARAGFGASEGVYLLGKAQEKCSAFKSCKLRTESGRISFRFDRRIVATTPGRFFTRVVHAGVHPRLHVQYKSCDIKQYFKQNRALRTETTINNAKDFGIGKDIANLWQLRRIGSDINRRLLQVERVSQDCALDLETVDNIAHPTVTQDGQRAPGLRFGDSRTMALMAAVLAFSHLPRGFTNAALRTQVAALLGPDASYGTRQMTYDLRRLRLKGLIARQPNSQRYRLTPLGLHACAFFTKLDARVFRPASAAMHPQDPVPRPLRRAFRRLDEAVDELVQNAHFKAVS
jgi:hypothetical protein